MQNAVMLAAAVVALNYKWIKFCFFCHDTSRMEARSIGEFVGGLMWAVYEKEKQPAPIPHVPDEFDHAMIQFGQSKPSVHDPGHNKDELDKVRHINKNIDGNTGI